MKKIEKINQHIEKILEERGLQTSLSDIFYKHRLLSFKFWRGFSFVTLFPFCIFTSTLFSNIFSSVSLGRELSGLAEHLLYFSFLSSGFFIPLVLSILILTQYLPLYKLSQKKFYKKYLEKYFRKSITIASSCDTLNYKEQIILKYSQDKELNLAMSAYYQYLLEFKFPLETTNSIIARKENLLKFDLQPEKYQKKFVDTFIQFIQDFNFYSTCSIVIKENYSKELLSYTESILSDTQTLSTLEEKLLDGDNSDKEKNKKVFKNML